MPPSVQDLIVWKGSERPDPQSDAAPYTFQVLPYDLVDESWLPADPAPPHRRYAAYPVDRQRFLEGLDWLLTVECDVVNLSTAFRGGFDPEDPLQLATRALTESGKTVVVAAGNYGPDPNTMQALARAPWVVSVAALDDELAPLKISSRGGSAMPGPTCASIGRNIYDACEQSTSFSAPRVAGAAWFATKCLELLVGDIRNAIKGTATEWSAPVRFPWVGFADSGWDPDQAPLQWGPISSGLLPKSPAIEIQLSAEERAWAERFVDALAVREVQDVDSIAVKRTLEIAARKLDLPSEAVGFGFIDQNSISTLIRDLRASVVATLLGIDVPATHLDEELGPYWSTDRITIAEDAFRTGVRFSVAKVR